MSKIVFVLGMLLVISTTVNIMQILNFKYKYERIKNVYLRKEKKLLEKAVEQNKEIIALQTRAKIREIK